MRGHRSRFTRRTRLLGSACSLAVIVMLAGCASDRNLTTGSIRPTPDAIAHMNKDQLDAMTRRAGDAYAKNPKDRDVGLSYASLLRTVGRNDQALAVMQQVAINHPTDRDVLAAYGKAQAAAGDFNAALDTIHRAQTPDHPDWRLLSAEGAILDQLGRSEEARDSYRQALVVQPDEPSVLSNLGMSYVLTGDLPTAESYMRKAAAQPGADGRIRQNLALVVGLQGRFAEAEKIASADLPPKEAQANVAYLRSMLAQQNAWSKLAAADKGKKKTASN